MSKTDEQIVREHNLMHRSLQAQMRQFTADDLIHADQSIEAMHGQRIAMEFIHGQRKLPE